jgi:glycosyltransferase involved in cell wall biosynthesis
MPRVTSRGRLCFYSDYLYSVLVPSRERFAGGAETQLAQLVRALSVRDFDVNVVTCDFGQPPYMRVDGIGIYRSFPPHSAIPILRFFHPRLTRAISALRAADAEVYYVKGGGLPAAITFEVARSRHAGFVIHSATDFDVVRSLSRHPHPRDHFWYRRALRGADLLLAQTAFQRDSLKREFGLESEVLPNVVEIPAEPVDPGNEGAVLWLGTYKPPKRPQWFTDLAAELPERHFVMTGVVPPPPFTQEPWHAAEAAAQRLSNLEVHGFVDHASVPELFRGASLLVHTSPVEGFSNVMLEAWAHGLPTVSAVDPDGVVSRLGLGAVATDFPQLVASVRSLLASPEARRAAGDRARQYAIAHHAPSQVLDRLASALDRVVGDVRRRRATHR